MVRVFCLILAVVLSACAAAEETPAAGDAAATDAAAEPADNEAATDDTDGGDDPVANACPPEGCEVEIVDVVAEGEELGVTWDANFLPDASKNHVHVFWDTFTAEQVSSDAEARGVEQGDWVPTDAFPTYVTDGVVAVANRAASTTLCVTAADRDHAVLDPSIVNCVDVGDVLEG